MKVRYVTLILLLWQRTRLRVQQHSHFNAPSYIAAVVEYSPVTESMGNQNLGELNAKNYLKIIDKAANYGTDIIVFPESGLAVPSQKNKTYTRSLLASYIPDPADNVIPCTDRFKYYEYTIRSMSCAARYYQMYILVNHREKVDCTPGEGCANDGLLIYNTNVAFDRSGQVIAKYRKNHLYREVGVNRSKPMHTTFTKDFGVTFGTFICFDIEFPIPSLSLIHNLGITDILYPTHWYNWSPLLFAVELQAGYAYATDVNFLVSVISNPKTNSTGSGIFLGKQGYAGVISESKRSNVLMVAAVPKVINGKRTKNIDQSKVHVYEFTKEEISTSETDFGEEHYILETIAQTFTTVIIDLNDRKQNKTVCNEDLCCHFDFTIDFDRNSITNDTQYYRYRLGARNKTLNEEYFGWAVFKTCVVLACTNDSADSCGIIFHEKENTITPITFTSLKISTQNVTNDNIFVIPSVYSQRMVSYNVTDFSLISSNFGNFSIYHVESKKPLNNILVFGLYGRSSDMDRMVSLTSVK